jgi:hypothetical protein
MKFYSAVLSAISAGLLCGLAVKGFKVFHNTHTMAGKPRSSEPFLAIKPRNILTGEPQQDQQHSRDPHRSAKVE